MQTPYTPKTNSYRKSSKDQILDLFNELHYKWRDGMDITSWRVEKIKHENVFLSMHTFMDDALADIGASLIDAGRATHHAVVAWLSCCEYNEYANEIRIYTRSQWFAERASSMFGAMIYDLKKKPVKFIFNKNVKDRIAA
jgi:hypothetical protein